MLNTFRYKLIQQVLTCRKTNQPTKMYEYQF